MAWIDMAGGRGGDCTSGGLTLALGSFLPPEIRQGAAACSKRNNTNGLMPAVDID